MGRANPKSETTPRRRTTVGPFRRLAPCGLGPKFAAGGTEGDESGQAAFFRPIFCGRQTSGATGQARRPLLSPRRLPAGFPGPAGRPALGCSGGRSPFLASVIRLVAVRREGKVFTVIPIIARLVRRWARPLLLVGLLSWLAPSGWAAADDDRTGLLREQIHTLETMVAQAKDAGEKASLGQKLQRVREELSVLEEQEALEARERGLRENAE